MFGMTKKQFLKKSKDCLKDTGIELLLIRKLFYQENQGKINTAEAFQKLEKNRKSLENIFFKYEGLKSPSKCKPLHMKILKTIIILQEALVINSEYLSSIKDSGELESKKLEKSLAKLEQFKDEFKKLSIEVDSYLK
ncbi:MAG: hypothetical protein KO316_04985 [Methanobacterium sp.]|jgi:hypothetical protein|nr:hypothetical protein [Methanobacterium sp.]